VRPPHAQPAVEITGLRFAYGAVPVLSDVTLTIAAGEFLGIVGPNAGGKSTLLKLILGLLRPLAGRIRVFGESPQRAAGSSAMCRSTRASSGTSPSASRTSC
jgi:zinc transport system ATP-binding protein